MKFIKDTLLTFSTTLITIVLGVITSIIIARALGPSNLGIYSLFALTFSLLGTFGSLGIAISNTYYGVKKEHEWGELASNSVISAFMVGMILIAFYLFFYFVFEPSFLKEIDMRIVLLASITLPFILLTSYLQNILLGQKKLKEYNSISIIQALLYLSLIIMVFFLNWDLQGVIISWIISLLITAMVPIILVYRSTHFKLHFNTKLFKKSVNLGVKGYLGNVIQFFNYRIDMYLVNFLLVSTASVGYYSLSVGLAESLWYLPASIGTLIFARTPGLTDEERNRSTPQICRNTLFITIILAIILAITAKYIILILYGPQYLPAYEPLLMLLPGIITLSICKVLSNEITGRGKPIINTYAAIVSLTVNIPLNILFIPHIGIVGSALASSVSYTVTTVLVVSYFLKISKSTLKETLILQKQDIKIYRNFLTNVCQTIKNYL